MRNGILSYLKNSDGMPLPTMIAIIVRERRLKRNLKIFPLLSQEDYHAEAQSAQSYKSSSRRPLRLCLEFLRERGNRRKRRLKMSEFLFRLKATCLGPMGLFLFLVFEVDLYAQSESQKNATPLTAEIL